MSLKEYIKWWKTGISDVIKIGIITSGIIFGTTLVFVLFSFISPKFAILVLGSLVVFGVLPIMVGWAKTEEEWSFELPFDKKNKVKS